MIILFKGAFYLVKRFRHKPISEGIKVFSLCESSTGYVYDMYIWDGRPCIICHRGPPGQRYSNTTAIVCRLIDSLKEKWHHVYLDNYFISVDLMAKAYYKYSTLITGFFFCSLIACSTKFNTPS